MRILAVRLLLVVLLAPLPSACEPTVSAYPGGEGTAPLVRRIDPPRNVLFIGNSFTYYNEGVDLHLARLAAATDPVIPVHTASRVTPAQNLKGHFEDRRTHGALAAESWDIVVLQGSSFEPVTPSTQQEFLDYADRLDAEIREIGARTAFFMTWAYLNEPEMTAALATTYTGKANELNALVVPVGLAWERALSERPGIALYSDRKHSNLRGTYLAACVFYAALLGRSPEESSYHAGLPVDDARFLQRIARETTDAFFSR